jgi:hypothetical protein
VWRGERRWGVTEGAGAACGAVRGALDVGAACGAAEGTNPMSGATNVTGTAGGARGGAGAARGTAVGPEPVVYQKDLLEKEKQKQVAARPG